MENWSLQLFVDLLEDPDVHLLGGLGGGLKRDDGGVLDILQVDLAAGRTQGQALKHK